MIIILANHTASAERGASPDQRWFVVRLNNDFRRLATCARDDAFAFDSDSLPRN